MAPRLSGVDLSLIDSLLVPASVHDVNGRFVHMNAGAERASGKSNAEMLGRHYTDLLHADARRHVEAQFRRAVEVGTPTDFETVFVDAGGDLRGVRAQHLPLRIAEEVVGVLILAFDVRPAGPALPRPASPPRLTRRQRQVLDLAASGLNTSEIASTLTLAPDTVRNHMRNVLRGLGSHTRLEAIATARRLGLLASAPLGAGRPK
jgi:PAS domain S-box-containing protein